MIESATWTSSLVVGMLVLILPLTGTLMAITPYLMPKRECFAVTVPDAAANDPFLRGLKRGYLWRILALTALGTAITVALFALAGSNAGVPKADSDPKVAAQVSSKSAWAVTNAFGDDALSSANDLSSAIEELRSGKVDYLASDAVIGMYAANRTGADVEVVALIDSASGYCVAVAETATDLQTAVKNALQTLISNGTVGVIEQKWLGTQLDLESAPLAEVKKTPSDNAEEPAEGDASSSSSAAVTA